MEQIFLISDAAKKVNVESHVLRYWEEELKLPIKRNALGHRYYTEDDILRFQEVRELKEKGLQLKAIRMVMKGENLNMPVAKKEDKEIRLINREEHQLKTDDESVYLETKEEKAKRLQILLKQLFRETLRENNQRLCQEVKDSLAKEMDYQFRMQDEKDEERYTERRRREEEHYKQVDELLRKKRGIWNRGQNNQEHNSKNK